MTGNKSPGWEELPCSEGLGGRPPQAPAALRTRLGPLELEHPLINASGTLDLLEAAETLGQDLLEHPPVAAYVPKTVTLAPRRGNEPPRIVQTASGMLNSIGLPNQGVEELCRTELPRLLRLPCPLILNVAGFSREEYVAAAERLRLAVESFFPALDGPTAADTSAPTDTRAPGGGPTPAGATAPPGDTVPAGGSGWWTRVGLEVNISCPNVHSGCMSIGADAGETHALLAALRQVWPQPYLLIPKLTPNVTDIRPIALAARDAGASALALVNTFKGMALDPVNLRPLLGGVTGGLSGPAIKPLALRAVYEVRETVALPLIGIGGVSQVQDVLDFIAAGASVVAVGSAGFRDPWLPRRLALALAAELESRGLSLAGLLGMAHSSH